MNSVASFLFDFPTDSGHVNAAIGSAKASDKDSRNKLLFKLHKVGISDTILKWIKVYLYNFRQVVYVHVCLSCWL